MTPPSAVPLSPATYAELYRAGGPAPGEIRGVCGRVIRGKSPAEFEWLSGGRRFAWVYGPGQMAGLIGRSTWALLISIGQSPEKIVQYRDEGFNWKLAVIPERELRRADWPNLMALAQDCYPAVGGKLARWSTELQAGEVWKRVPASLLGSPAKSDPSDPNHMSPSRYLEAADTPENAWLFLCHSLGINKHFAGSGYTQPADGSAGGEEYFVANQRLTDIAGAVLLDLPAPITEPD